MPVPAAPHTVVLGRQDATLVTVRPGRDRHRGGCRCHQEDHHSRNSSSLTYARTTELSMTGDQGLPDAETWDIDENSSSIFFVVRNRFTSLRGEFSEFSGILTFHPAPERSRVGVKIVVASISTGHARQDAALRGAHFLDAARFPWLVFHSTSVRHLGGQRYVLTGDLTVRDVTRPVILDLDYLGLVDDPSGRQWAGFSARTEIRLDDFGISGHRLFRLGGVLAGTTVRIEFELDLSAPERPGSVAPHAWRHRR
jgi:polyisoprenoid-binding protein YceI